MIRTRRLVQTVAVHIQWNPVKKSLVARELNISKMLMSSMLSDLGVRAYQHSTSHFLTLRLKEKRAIKSKCIFQHYADNGQRRISFHRWLISRRFSISTLTEFMPRHWETHDKAPKIPSSCFSHGFVRKCRTMPPPSSISVKKVWKPRPKSMRTPCWSLLWSFLPTLCSVMNIGALSRIWHLPASQTLPRSDSGQLCRLHYSGFIDPSTAPTSAQSTPRVCSAWR